VWTVGVVNLSLPLESVLELLLSDFRDKSDLLDTYLLGAPKEYHRHGVITMEKSQSKIGS